MTKREAIESFVERDFHGVPTDWIKIVAEKLDAEIYSWPMWGTMWLVDHWLGKKLMKGARLEEMCDKECGECKKCQSCDEEMRGAYCVQDKDGGDTSAYIYEIDGQYILGIHGAGWNFYDGVWDRLYDLLGLDKRRKAKGR